MGKKFSFKDYEKEIREISRANNVDMGVAYDMFRADVRNGTNENCGSCMEGFDFGALKTRWDALSKEEQERAYQEWHASKRA